MGHTKIVVSKVGMEKRTAGDRRRRNVLFWNGLRSLCKEMVEMKAETGAGGLLAVLHEDGMFVVVDTRGKVINVEFPSTRDARVKWAKTLREYADEVRTQIVTLHSK